MPRSLPARRALTPPSMPARRRWRASVRHLLRVTPVGTLGMPSQRVAAGTRATQRLRAARSSSAPCSRCGNSAESRWPAPATAAPRPEWRPRTRVSLRLRLVQADRRFESSQSPQGCCSPTGMTRASALVIRRGASRPGKSHLLLRFEQFALAWPRERTEVRFQAFLGGPGRRIAAILVQVVLTRVGDFLHRLRHLHHPAPARG